MLNKERGQCGWGHILPETDLCLVIRQFRCEQAQAIQLLKEIQRGKKV